MDTTQTSLAARPVPSTEHFLESIYNSAELDAMLTHAQEFRQLMSYHKCAIMEVETKFNVLNEEFSLQHDRTPIVTIQGRVKTPQSIREKLARSGQPMTIDTIENVLSDVSGVRVVCSFLDDVYMLEKALLAQDDITLLKRKDYIANPKPNGYRSLHLIVETPIFMVHTKKMMKVEIQLRTIAMDFWATLEHQLNYKKTTEKTAELVQELRQCAELSSLLDSRMDCLRSALLTDK